MLEAPPSKILIIRPSAIGDIVMATPMAETLKKAWPKVKIDWLIAPMYASLLKAHPFVDDLIEWNKAEWKEKLYRGRLPSFYRSVRNLSKSLKAKDYDLVLDAQGLLRSRFLAWLSGGKERIGFDSKEPGRSLMTKIISRGPDSDLMSSEYHYMMCSLGIEPKSFDPLIALSKEDEEWAEAILKQTGIAGPYFVFCPFTTRPQKHWLMHYWVELANYMSRFYSIDIIVLGGPADKTQAEKIAKHGGESIHNFAGRCSLPQSAALLKRAALAIGVDTGLTHMATALKVPALAIFGSTKPYLDARTKSTKVLYSNLSCSPCKRKPTCHGQYECMRLITPQIVAQEAQNLILEQKLPS